MRKLLPGIGPEIASLIAEGSKVKPAFKRKALSGVLTAGVFGAGALGASSALANQLFFDFNQNLVSPTASVFLFGTAGQTANVSTLSGFNQNVVLSADGFFNLPINNTFQQSGTGIRNTGFKIDSPDPIAAYFINRGSASTDMTYVLDSAALGTNYVIASIASNLGEGSQAAIHAITDGTNVTFTPKGGAPINVVLNAGETYKYAGGGVDITGSTIVASNPVAVFSGHNCARVPEPIVACDTLLEQMIPNNNLSSDYLLTASKGAEFASRRTDLVTGHCNRAWYGRNARWCRRCNADQCR